MKLEYKVEHLPTISEHILNEIGAAGWELVQVVTNINGAACYFKREKHG